MVFSNKEEEALEEPLMRRRLPRGGDKKTSPKDYEDATKSFGNGKSATTTSEAGRIFSPASAN